MFQIENSLLDAWEMRIDCPICGKEIIDVFCWKNRIGSYSIDVPMCRAITSKGDYCNFGIPIGLIRESSPKIAWQHVLRCAKHWIKND